MEDCVKFALEAHGMEVLDDQGGAEDMIKWLEEPAVEAKSFVLGSPYTFHAAFNASVPAAPPAEAMRFEDLYKITEADEKRAAADMWWGKKRPREETGEGA